MKYLYGREALSGVDFSCSDGEKIAVLGGPEAGKTSLLKCLAGLFPAAEGKILIDGKDVTRAPVKERDVLMLYEDGGIRPWKPVGFHLKYPLKKRKFPKEEIEKKISSAAGRLRITPILTDLGRMLYDDDIVRLQFARTLTREPSVYLFDDPFKILTGGEREEVFSEILPVIKELKKPLIFASSSVDEAFSAGDKILFLHFGRQEQFASPGELKNSPATLTVDKFVNRRNARGEFDIFEDENGIFITILNKKVYLPLGKEYSGKKLFASYSLKESEDGEETAPRLIRYFGGGPYAVFDEGALKIERFKASYRLSPEKITLFGYSDEKRLTTIG